MAIGFLGELVTADPDLNLLSNLGQAYCPPDSLLNIVKAGLDTRALCSDAAAFQKLGGKSRARQITALSLSVHTPQSHHDAAAKFWPSYG
jgi:hypothetical protein